ncbi:hypothetical protein AC626_25680, partial [Pseudoalteromonas rubra]
AGLALGYLDQPALTAERFVRNPFGDGVLYRTGDLVRVGEDGNLLFMGRTDNQVKIRGFRVELGEIVHQIDSLAGVQSSLVQVTGEEAADKQLVAWVVAQQDTELDVETLKAALAERVPAHMVPTYLVLLAEWPLTSVGKIDRRALPAPDKVSQQAVYVAPQGAQEAALVDIWAELLKIEPAQLGVNTNFFSIGGHSLLAVQMIAKIRAHFDLELSVRMVFDHPTVRELAEALVSASCTRLPALVAQDRVGPLALSFAQQRLWFIEQLQGPSSMYNMPFALRITGTLPASLIEQALAEIVTRHEVLRTTYTEHNEQPIQVVHDSVSFTLGLEELNHLDDTQRADYIAQAQKAEAAHPFDLDKDQML